MRMTVLLLACGSVAVAQVPVTDIEQVWLDPSARGSLMVGTGPILKPLSFRIGTSLTFTSGQLRARAEANSVGTALVSERFGLQVFGAVGLFKWLEMSFNLPVIIAQRGDSSLALAGAGVGNPWIHAKFGLLDSSKLASVSIALGLGVPVGTAAAQGNGGIEFMPRVNVGKVFTNFQVGLELGGLLRPTVDYRSLTQGASDRVGAQMYLAGTLTGINLKGPRGELAVRAFAPLTGGQPGFEAQLGARWPIGDVELFGSIGPGFWGAPSTPSLRAYLGVALANEPLTRPPCIESEPYEIEVCPLLDRDADRVPNGVDAAPLVAEDRDGFQDADGQPDPDNDGDGVLDAEDACALLRGVAENKGCPDSDADQDGLVDRLDRCVQDTEDLDGFQDEDGCPEADNDGDGVPDDRDACRDQAGVVEELGCPAKDSDSDGVFDSVDNCPAQGGPPANAGCPETVKQRVLLTKEKLTILDKVFFDTGKATIQPKSLPLLDQVAAVLAAHLELGRVQIEGHTDNAGKPENNKRLSQQRADAVKAYLENKGVAPARLNAVGYGAEKPVVTNDSPAGRETNRRVEFTIL
jgi:OmpA-OmpF porin, OOP family